MKRLLSFAGVLLLFSAHVSCTKKEDAPPSPAPRSNYHARIANREWDAVQYYAAVDSNRIRISGRSSDGRSLLMDLKEFKAGSYKIDRYSGNKALYTDSTWSPVRKFDSNLEGNFTGKVVIESIDEQKKTVSGTFDFVLADLAGGGLLTVEKGVFTSIPYGPPIVDTTISDTTGIDTTQLSACDFMPYTMGSQYDYSFGSSAYEGTITVLESSGAFLPGFYKDNNGNAWKCDGNYAYTYGKWTEIGDGDTTLVFRYAKTGMAKGMKWMDRLQQGITNLALEYEVINDDTTFKGEEGLYHVQLKVSGPYAHFGGNFHSETHNMIISPDQGLVFIQSSMFIYGYEIRPR